MDVMNFQTAKDKLEDVLNSGRMTTKAKEDIKAVVDMLTENLRRYETRDNAKELGLQTCYNNPSISRDIQRAVRVLQTHPAQYDIATDDLKKLQAMQEDILHALELLDEDEKQLMKYTKDLINVRKQRRAAKDYLEIATPLKKLANKYPNIGKDLNQCLKNAREIEEFHKKRIYTPRELTAIEEAFKKLEVV
ncbi:hypothetical protein SB773_26270 [Bacillus sp. SIMBA_074]|uniref:hypothetical protein n=1 Tax=Bacillus sp. SIMBA_074 TaxID=3085812 RepID=UPI00397DBFA7